MHAMPCHAAGWHRCTPVAKDCGIGPGSPCCPLLPTGSMRTNPALKRGGCPDKLADSSNNPDDKWRGQYCHSPTYGRGSPNTVFRGGDRQSDMVSYRKGVCKQNDPDCGIFGKPCCILHVNSKSGYMCDGEDYRTGICDKDMICNPRAKKP